MYVWRMEKAAGEGRENGRTGRWSVVDGGDAGGGIRGSDAQCDARIRECTGNSITESLDDFEDDTASTWVG